MDKLKIIEGICKEHPTYGVDKGWSEYTGGMMDTGRWFIERMLKIDVYELADFLADIYVEQADAKLKEEKQIKVEDSKYYVPSIKEFHVGFEYLCCYGVDWDKIPDDLANEFVRTFIGETIKEVEEYLGDDSIRVKYLDREDIESLGYIQSIRESYYESGGFQIYYDGKHHQLSILNENAEYLVRDIYVWNKSELRYLLERLEL